MADAREALTKEQVDWLLRYDPETGIFTHNRQGQGRRLGRASGRVNEFGYQMLWLNHRRYRAHRVAWLLMTGAWPPAGKDVDHINRVRSDNRWVNLRLATRKQSCGNRTMTKRNTSGFRGVSRTKNSSTWTARLCPRNGKMIRLGSFKTKEEASAAYEAAAKKYFGAEYLGELRAAPPPTQGEKK